MRKHLGMVVLAGLVLVLLVVYTVSVPVSQLKDLVVVTTFGRTTRVLSGQNPDQAGLHFKWIFPIQQEVRFDARTHLMEDTLESTLTRDGKMIDLSVFCAWRIEDANRFLSTIKSEQAAQDPIKSAIRDAKAQAVGVRDLSELVNTDPARMKLAEVEEEFGRAVSRKLRDEYGVGVVMIGVRRLGLSKAVSETVIETMKEERRSKAKEYTGIGEAQATTIRERARAASEKILAFAKRKAEGVRRQGDREAAAYYEKFSGHEDLAVFLRSLEALKNELASRAVILLSESSQPMIQWFRAPPTAESMRRMTTSRPAEATGSKTAGPEN